MVCVEHDLMRSYFDEAYWINFICLQNDSWLHISRHYLRKYQIARLKVRVTKT